MQTHQAIETSSMTRRFRVGAAVALSLALHCGIAYAVMDAASVYGLANVTTPSISVEEVQTVVLEAILPTENVEPPPASTAQQASVAAPEPTPDQHVPETPGREDRGAGRRRAGAAGRVSAAAAPGAGNADPGHASRSSPGGSRAGAAGSPRRRW